METIRYGKGFEEALKQCRQVIEHFEGSQETLRHILNVEESLRKLSLTID
jgi:hypothetical protein